MRHAADIYRAPTGAYASRGELIGTGQLVASGVPCSIETLSGREAEIARSTYSLATHQIELFGDPAWLPLETCKLVVGQEVYHVGHVNDLEKRGVEFVLLCGQEIAEVASANG